MRTLRQAIILIGVSLALIAALIGGLTYYAYRRPLPKQEGAMIVEGMRDETRMYRDSWGVAHLYAATPYDLFFAQGFTHAQDRWWQMDISRRLGHGTLSELLGPSDTVQQIDQLARTLGWERLAEAMWEAASPEARLALHAYAAGVNAYIAERSPGELALEYTVLDLRLDNLTVTPWTPLDSLAWAVALHWETAGNAAQELENARLAARVDDTMIPLLTPFAPPADSPTILTAGDLGILPETPVSEPAPLPAVAGEDYSRLPLDSALAALDLIGPRAMLEGSAWVVNGQMTASGLPLLAVAPNLPARIPSPWYEIGLHCIETTAACAYNVTGLSIPGLPAVIMGHNNSIAWGMTSAWVDEQDVYVIRLNPDNPQQYAWGDGWTDLQAREETLVINGQDAPLPFTVYETALGPLIGPPPADLDGDQALVLRWSGQSEPLDLIGALLRLNRAQNWHDFRTALESWDGPVINVIYADVNGNIGYQLAGRVPVRAAAHSGRLPVAAQAETEWRGFLPFEALPSALNPARGYIIAANNRIAPAAYEANLAANVVEWFGADASPTLGGVWDPGYRAAQIGKLLLAREAHTVDTFADIQGNVTSPVAAAVLPYLFDLDLEDPALSEMQDWLKEWDTQYSISSPQAALFGVFWRRLLEFTYADELGALPCDCPATPQAMLELLANPNHAWWDDVQTDSVIERRDAILRRAFEQAIGDLTARFGEDRSTWNWGALHTVRFTHFLTDVFGMSVIEDRFNEGPYPVSGSGDTINVTRAPADATATWRVVSIPSARLIIDLSDFESSRAILATGQSNHLASAHYDDMIDPWRFIEYHYMLWEHENIEAAADAMLSLEPILNTPVPDTAPE